MNNKRQPTSHESQNRLGSALILTVVLTSMLAIVGVLFLLVARLDKMATSAISENKELNLAVETAIAKISQELVLDVPGVAGQEDYYDYPDINNIWLANLEPDVNTKGTLTTSDDIYFWPQISNITGIGGAWRDLQAEIIDDYQPSIVAGTNADADGDGVADSRWVIISDMTSSKGKPIYAAVRVVDNGGMLNVNTGFKFDPCDTNIKRIDGSSQLQINLMALAGRDNTHTTYPGEKEDRLWSFRCGSEPNDIYKYEQNVIWQYNSPNGAYTPFDIGDELKLRNRYILNYNEITTRIEKLWTNAYEAGPRVPLPTTQYPFSRWPDCTIGDIDPNDYEYRHFSTTYNMDRIINPDGDKMMNINRIYDPNYLDKLYQALLNSGIDNATAAQLAVNMKDYIDPDPNVTVYMGYYGFEQPCIYISELAHNFKQIDSIIHMSYAVELFKQYLEDTSPVGWRLVVNGVPISIDNPVWSSAKQVYVIRNQDDNASLGQIGNADIKDTNSLIFSGGEIIELQRPLPDGSYITVDSNQVPLPRADWLVVDGFPHSIERDIWRHKCIKRLWNPNARSPRSTSLGRTYSYYRADDVNNPDIQAHPYLDPMIYGTNGFKNIGEIGMLFVKSAYSQGPNPIGSNDTEVTARLDLQNPAFQQIFNYLTVFDPANYGWPESETRVKGRININTAPWFVIAQLPWVSQRIDRPLIYELAKTIVAYRDKTFVPDGPNYSDRLGEPGFRSIGELNNDFTNYPAFREYGMDYYALDSNDLNTFPDLTYDDDAGDDFEERDVIFSRISNLVTVRSDVFTAYILVRIGTDGPQKRVMAILDRSNVYSPGDKVRIVALHQVPDPR